jgi:transcriptional regulator with XRE-family HTH domain
MTIHDDLLGLRTALGVSQEGMARLLGVSFASVNRWEGGHSSPTGPTRDLCQALRDAIRVGAKPERILEASDGPRGAFLYTVFKLAYGGRPKAPR